MNIHMYILFWRKAEHIIDLIRAEIVICVLAVLKVIVNVISRHEQVHSTDVAGKSVHSSVTVQTTANNNQTTNNTNKDSEMMQGSVIRIRQQHKQQTTKV